MEIVGYIYYALVVGLFALIFLFSYFEEQHIRLEIEDAVDSLSSQYFYTAVDIEDTDDEETPIGFVEVCTSFTTKRERQKVIIRRIPFKKGDHKSFIQAKEKADAITEQLNSEIDF